MIHHFDARDAELYGVEAAAVLYNLRFWIAHNWANEKHFYEGRTWTYNSAKAFSKLMPYLSAKKLWRILDELTEKGVILKGNFNKSGYDRTTWYAFADESFLSEFSHFPKVENAFSKNEKCISQNWEIDFPKVENGFSKSGKPIPYIKTNEKTDECNVSSKHVSSKRVSSKHYSTQALSEGVQTETDFGNEIQVDSDVDKRENAHKSPISPENATDASLPHPAPENLSISNPERISPISAPVLKRENAPDTAQPEKEPKKRKKRGSGKTETEEEKKFREEWFAFANDAVQYLVGNGGVKETPANYFAWARRLNKTDERVTVQVMKECFRTYIQQRGGAYWRGNAKSFAQFVAAFKEIYIFHNNQNSSNNGQHQNINRESLDPKLRREIERREQKFAYIVSTAERLLGSSDSASNGRCSEANIGGAGIDACGDVGSGRIYDRRD